MDDIVESHFCEYSLDGTAAIIRVPYAHTGCRYLHRLAHVVSRNGLELSIERVLLTPMRGLMTTGGATRGSLVLFCNFASFASLRPPPSRCPISPWAPRDRPSVDSSWPCFEGHESGSFPWCAPVLSLRRLAVLLSMTLAPSKYSVERRAVWNS